MYKLLLGLALFFVCSTVVANEVLLLEYVSYEDSLKLAKEQNKKVFVLFTADYCSWCEKQKEVLQEGEVLIKLKSYVICFVDTQKRKDLAEKFNVKTIPNYFILDQNGEVLKKHVGYKNAKDFSDWLIVSEKPKAKNVPQNRFRVLK
jgi:thioredoxin-related protein